MTKINFSDTERKKKANLFIYLLIDLFIRACLLRISIYVKSTSSSGTNIGPLALKFWYYRGPKSGPLGKKD